MGVLDWAFGQVRARDLFRHGGCSLQPSADPGVDGQGERADRVGESARRRPSWQWNFRNLMPGHALKRSRRGPKVGIPKPQGAEQLGAGYFPAENQDTVTILRGQVVAVHPDGIWRANASDDSRNAVGLMSEDTAVGSSNNVVTDEVFTMADWTNVTGEPSLNPGDIYFLDIVSGKLTTTAPSVPGQVAQQVGRAISSIALDIECEEAILL